MLLTSRRHGLLYFCLAGMEIAWITPFFLLFYRPLAGTAPGVVFVGLFGSLLVFMLILELLDLLQVDWPFYEAAVAGLILLTSLLFVRFWFYAGTPWGSFSWLGNTLGALFDFHQGIRPELVLLLTSVLLWQRATNSTSRDVGFFSVGFSFRLGLLLLILGAAILSILRAQDTRLILWLYLGLGLTAVAVARANDKATDTRSSGSLLSLRRLAQLLLAVGITVSIAAWLSFLYTPDRIGRTLFIWLRPVWTLLSPVLKLLLQLLFLVLQPILLGLEWLLSRLMRNLDWTFISDVLDTLGESFETERIVEQNEGFFSTVPAWVWTGLRGLLVVLAVAVVVGFVLLFLNRMRAKSDRGETEEESGEEVTLGGAMLGRGLRWLRGVARLVGRFGLSRQLLAAISVQNMYANLCRLGRQRGYPRHPAQPPDAYLPLLNQAFSGQEEALTHITTAYMRVHYGDRPVTPDELAGLREYYQQVRRNG